MKAEKPISRRTLLECLTRTSLGIAVGAAPFQRQTLYAGNGRTQPDQRLVEPSQSDEKKFVPVMITPFDSHLKIDFDRLSMLIDFYLKAGAKGFFANCLSSEMYLLTNQERIDLTRHVVKHVGRKAAVVSTGSFGDTLEEKADFAKKIYDTGARGVILISSHFALANESDAVLEKNFERFLSLTNDIKVGTYECPVPYKRLLAPDVFRSLVSDKRLIYHKDTSEDIKNIEAKLALARGTQLEFYNAHTATAAESLQKGAKGMSPISGNFYPEIHSWLCQYANDPAKSAEVNWIQAEITRTEPIISKYYPLSSKYFLKKRGLPLELVCRAKAKSIPPEHLAVLDKTYDVFLGWCDRLGIKAVNGPQ
ncbi:dihydrodipicolinate synthase family protein [Larkinella insperata]|uniref:Dihydrodipicolinate synthase family protein n=1 Tax=Larkinella insperata TaxID=332158 RepID=A0ABW3QGA6_9BACT|nr:dihydrodipicolinate synthase family protein [Larkinella insperata]